MFTEKQRRQAVLPQCWIMQGEERASPLPSASNPSPVQEGQGDNMAVEGKVSLLCRKQSRAVTERLILASVHISRLGVQDETRLDGQPPPAWDSHKDFVSRNRSFLPAPFPKCALCLD